MDDQIISAHSMFVSNSYINLMQVNHASGKHRWSCHVWNQHFFSFFFLGEPVVNRHGFSLHVHVMNVTLLLFHVGPHDRKDDRITKFETNFIFHQSLNF
jgi:hypothetical protein